mgnify:CR=1 FL=1
MVRINTESQPINKLVKIINMKNIGLDRLIGPDVLSCYRDYFYMIGGIMLVLFVPLGPLLDKQ